MADEPAKPTEDQVKAANEAEKAKWEGDYKEEDLIVPYKREEPAAEEPEKVEGVETSAVETPAESYTEPEPVITVEDPGDYKPADYSFEVTLKDGKTVKVATPEEAEKLADDPDNFETPKQLMDFINKQNKMNRNLERDYEKWETQKKTFSDQLETETQRREQIDGYVGEFQYLVNKGLLPAVDKKYLDADWSDPEVAKQPGVKEQIELLNYMVEENKVRAKAKVKPLTSVVDAYNAWKQDEGTKKTDADRKAAEDAKKAADAARKVAGGRVAGVSATEQTPYVPKGIAVGRADVFKRGAAVWDD